MNFGFLTLFSTDPQRLEVLLTGDIQEIIKIPNVKRSFRFRV